MVANTKVESEIETGDEQVSAHNGSDHDHVEKSSAETAAVSDEGAENELGQSQAGETGDRPRGPKAKWRTVTFGVLPGLALVLALAAGFLKWQDASVRDAGLARIESVQAAKDSTVAMLSYRPETAEKDLGAARDRLTGTFKDSYTSLIHDVVIPGAKQRQISAVATVPAAASVSADPDRAVVLVFVNQTAIVGTDAPTDTASTVRMTLDKVDGHWLVSQFDPI
jgi:Mce-associated membrane protein